jgi:adenylate cyclase
MKGLRISKEKSVVILVSLIFVALSALVLYFRPPFFNEWMIKLESDAYDRQVRRHRRALSPDPSIAIVAIDDQSISEEGRWPWDRAKLAKLTAELSKLGAKVIAYDLVFSEFQENPVETVLRAVDAPMLKDELKQLKPDFDGDAMFARALEKQTAVLGFAFAQEGQAVGELPSPLLTLSEIDAKESLIPNMTSYIGNQPLFQKAVGNGGFVNAMVDSDGILRFSPLLIRDREKVYPSLALESARLFLSLPLNGVISSYSGPHQIIRSIRLGSLAIPTDPWGRILIPFRGPSNSFPHLSATDVLQGKVAPEKVRGKLIFVGMTATAASDLFATAISPVFTGIEIQATIASGIIDGYLPYKPNWGRGSAIAIVLILGVIAAFVFPFINQIAVFLICVCILAIAEAVNQWMWMRHGVVLAFFFPIPTLFTIFTLEMINIYIGNIRHKNELKRMFGQYMPSKYLDELIKKKQMYTIAGETKEISILFVGICDFPSVIETFSAIELREFLNRYFTAINQTVFENRGIVDKLSRDQVTAFWGAPFTEPQHAIRAVETALAIRDKLSGFSPPIEIGIGINTGIVHVGDMGSKFNRDYTAIGRPVDWALQLKNLTQKYSAKILVGQTTYLQTKDRFKYQKVDSITVDGKIEEIYTICQK